jgi:arsenate reductase (thioredoxin)
MGERTYNVLFLSRGNAARSLFAETILNELGQGRFHGFSAGSQPDSGVNPYALSVLRNAGHDLSEVRPKGWEEFSGSDASLMSFVISLCDDAAHEPCPVWPGRPTTAHWSIPDPATATGTEVELMLAFDDVYRMLRQRIELLLALPLSSLDDLTLQNRLRTIGEAQPT